MTAATQLSLLEALADAPAPRARVRLEGAFSVFVATPEGEPQVGPLPVVAGSHTEAETEAATRAGVDPEKCLALPAREGDWCDELMAMLAAANERAEADLQQLRGIHAKILGCSIEDLDARVAAEEAARRASLPPKAPRGARRGGGRAAPAPQAPPSSSALPMTRLDERQRELLALVRVEGNVAVYTREERIPDWDALKGVLVALGGTWRSKKGFVFPDFVDAAERVRLALETGEILDPRTADFFPTPDWLAERLVALADLRPGDRVLEPSAGRGAIARAVRSSPRLGGFADITCIELLPDNVAVLRADGLHVIEGSFLDIAPGTLAPFDVVAMNPPFEKSGGITHVRHALAMLKPGGRLVSIMSAGVEYRDDTRDFRELVAASGGRIEANPDGSFLESGTGVRTVSVVMNAPRRA